MRRVAGRRLNLEIPITSAERDALEAFIRRNGTVNKFNLSMMATFILGLALMHRRELEGWIDQLMRYYRAEGINQVTFIVDSIARQYPSPAKRRRKPQAA